MLDVPSEVILQSPSPASLGYRVRSLAALAGRGGTFETQEFMSQDRSFFSEFARVKNADLPFAGFGSGWRRFTFLAGWASRDLSLERIREGYADALATSVAAGMKRPRGATYGVWTSRGRSATTIAGAKTILEKVASAGRVGPTCDRGGQSRQVAHLNVYVSQKLGGADAAELGRAPLKARSWT